MTEPTPGDMAAKLLAERFERSGPVADMLSDPIADTPMVVTLDQLRPYELNPRVTRNPRYDEIKASIRERGLDAPPAITRRPGVAHYIIRNGGNTRLAILQELWSETKDERFFRIPCLFRPWPERGEIIALTGHLAENELHGGLSFIERALGVEKARELYEQESGQALTQAELARRLSADGYPVAQPHISRMQDAVRYLLPAIPSVLYGGLGRPQIERLTALRRASVRTWDARGADKSLAVDFPALFHEVLVLFDGHPVNFSVKRVQDELIGQMAELLEADYDTLTLEIGETEHRQRALTGDPSPNGPRVGNAPTPPTTPQPRRSHPEQPPTPAQASGSEPEPPPTPTPKAPASTRTSAPPTETTSASQTPRDDHNERLRAHIVSPASTTERLQSIQRLVADQMGDALPDFEANVLRAIPVQAGGLYPISDVWYIEPGLDTPDRLRVHIAQFAREIAQEAGQANQIESVDDGIGFVCATDVPVLDTHSMPWFARAVLTLLHALSAVHRPTAGSPTALDHLRLTDALGPLLQGRKGGSDARDPRLSDSGLVKLFRLLRLARRLLELESGTAPGAGAATES
jgi:ParB family protein of integrating conjugative element (PFGI_1 class)